MGPFTIRRSGAARRLRARPIKLVSCAPPVVGQPWEHGDCYPHRGTLTNADAPTSPQGAEGGDVRSDVRDYSVWAVHADGREYVIALPVGHRRKTTTVVSREQAEHVVADSVGLLCGRGSRCPATFATWTEQGRERAKTLGAFTLEARAN